VSVDHGVENVTLAGYLAQCYAPECCPAGRPCNTSTAAQLSRLDGELDLWVARECNKVTSRMTLPCGYTQDVAVQSVGGGYGRDACDSWDHAGVSLALQLVTALLVPAAVALLIVTLLPSAACGAVCCCGLCRCTLHARKKASCWCGRRGYVGMPADGDGEDGPHLDFSASFGLSREAGNLELPVHGAGSINDSSDGGNIAPAGVPVPVSASRRFLYGLRPACACCGVLSCGSSNGGEGRGGESRATGRIAFGVAGAHVWFEVASRQQPSARHASSRAHHIELQPMGSGLSTRVAMLQALLDERGRARAAARAGAAAAAADTHLAALLGPHSFSSSAGVSADGFIVTPPSCFCVCAGGGDRGRPDGRRGAPVQPAGIPRVPPTRVHGPCAGAHLTAFRRHRCLSLTAPQPRQRLR
jgi:hypothetical protein